ncbi:hypothetical protein [Amnibacterium kyonggiense]|uniref:DNA gyrase/topoisomerase IV subunit A-like protein n=1 Tax=Amnibacterium kyonggiense TaxID=595671 RepID=A0A4R7FRA2_9MICO|nr:hypothetical protein [Amnibacterium kyonggiense]TDS80355.1 DNA gyrase/topoisomerase IV subunit A-like protein [Amnibacterium kyonggiense]
MSERTGLGPLETAVIESVGALSGPASAYVRCADVLDALELAGFGANYLYTVLQDLTVSWRLHLPLLDGQGNFGSPGNDAAADPSYTEVRLSPVGRLALASEQGKIGPLPLSLIEGTLYRGGRVPPFDPKPVTDTLTRLLHEHAIPFLDADLDLLIGTPTLPTGGTVEGDLPSLLRGEPAEMRMSCRIAAVERQGLHVLEITGYPLGVDIDLITQCIAQRGSFENQHRGGGHHYIADVQDHSSERSGIQIQVLLRNGVDPTEAEGWLRTVWPVSVDQTWQLPAPMPHRLRETVQHVAGSPGGLRQLRALL